VLNSPTHNIIVSKMSEKKQNWFIRHPVATPILAIPLFLIFIGMINTIITEISSPSSSIKDYSESLEMSTEEIFDMFDGLSEIQQKEKIKKFKGTRIKTSIFVDKIDKASLSSQYVVMEMYGSPYNSLPSAKAFFPSEEKNNLLQANIGDYLIFSGEFVTYHEGALASYIEFTKSKVIEIK